MSNLYRLMNHQMERLKLIIPKSHGKPKVDALRVLRAVNFLNRNGLRWCDAPREFGPPKTFYNRWKRWCAMGAFVRKMEGRASEGTE